ncbi:endonuclease domain-containing protein [Bibersteinia trehalosi]
MKYDKQRTTFLEEQGFKVIRFWNNEVLANPDGILDILWEMTKE